MNVPNMKTGVVGLGAMGVPMARNLARAGLLACVWNRTPATARQLADELGVTCAEDPADLARRCDVILTCVSTDSDLLDVMDALLPGLDPGKIVVDTSTVQPTTAEDVEKLLNSAGCGFLDAPVSGGVEGAQQGALAIMVGGKLSLLERVRPVLEAVSRRIAHMGPVGSGQATKAVNQIMCAGINHAVTEALAFAEDLGLPLDKVIEVVSSGAAANWFLEKRGPTMVRCSFAPGFKLALHYKDLAICKAIAERRGVKLPVVEMTLIQYRRLLDSGYGDEDISALYREKRKLFDKDCEPGSEERATR
jgi:3-hydroxyisobutyrate dehydrogenase